MTISNPMFKFASSANAVKVENAPQSVARQEILQLFATLIGEVRKCDEYYEDGKRRTFEIIFAHPDAAQKALCMTGYTVAGVPLSVSALSHMDNQRLFKAQNRQTEIRRNLYVLGLPFDLTKSEFVEIFSRYGNVSHAVILATVDNASRRRGFVVMNTHMEAKIAMEALSRTEIKGYTIDVSWAVVQRSQGFLDGGDRTMVLTTSGSSGSSGFDSDVSPPGSTGLATPTEFQPSTPSWTPTLLVTNLPGILFSEPADLHPLLCPFGEVTHVKILNDGIAASQGNISVVVEYKTLNEAKDARDNLNGQCYTNHPVQAEFLLPKMGSPADGDCQIWNPSKGDMKTGLNPHAAPFLAQRAASFDGSMSVLPMQNGPIFKVTEDDNGSALSAASSSYASLPAFHSPVYPNAGLSAPQVDMIRPRSAPSRSIRGENDTRPGFWTYSSQTLPSLASTSMRSPFPA